MGRFRNLRRLEAKNAGGPRARRTGEPGSDERDEIMAILMEAEFRSAREIISEGRTPEKMHELAANAQGYAHENVGLIHRDMTPDCVEGGCSYCCHQPVVTTVPEVLRIADNVRSSRSPGDIVALTERTRASVALIAGMSPRQARDVRQECPLLDGDEGGRGGRCSVYEFRPMTCRCYHSMDVSRCQGQYERPEDESLTVPCIGLHVLGAVHSGLEAALGAEGLKPTRVNLNRALLIALEEPNSGERWLRGEPAFDDAGV